MEQGKVVAVRNTVGAVALVALFAATFYGGRMSTTVGFMSDAHAGPFHSTMTMLRDEGIFVRGLLWKLSSTFVFAFITDVCCQLRPRCWTMGK